MRMATPSSHCCMHTACMLAMQSWAGDVTGTELTGRHARICAAAPAVPTQTPAPSGCALSYVQSNSSYSMFASIIYAAPQSSNFSSAHPLDKFVALAPLA